MSKTIAKRLSLSLETIKSLDLDEVNGGKRRHKKPPVSSEWEQHTPPLNFHSANPSCGIICFQK
jgi:hypothetical protein